jgi:hypothetical protein
MDVKEITEAVRMVAAEAVRLVFMIPRRLTGQTTELQQEENRRASNNQLRPPKRHMASVVLEKKETKIPPESFHPCRPAH